MRESITCMKKRNIVIAIGIVLLAIATRPQESKMESEGPEVLENVELYTWSSRSECIKENHKPATLFGNEVQFPIEETRFLCNCFFRFKSSGVTEREMDICFEKFEQKYLGDL